MSQSVHTLERSESRRSVRGRDGADEFDTAQLMRVAAGGGLRTTYGSGDLLEEALIVDSRAGLRPAQAVERKLVLLLEGRALSISQLRLAPLSSRNRAAYQ